MSASRIRWEQLVGLGLALIITLPALSAQQSIPKKTQPAPVPATAEAPKDTLGRNTPRGTVVGFLNATKKNNGEIAVLYLDTPLRGEEALNLAKELAVVIDRRLPARLNEISDAPEGSVRDPLRPDEDLIGTISTSKGDINIVVERVDRGKSGKVWLFSRRTLASIPEVFDEISTPRVEEVLPEFLVKYTVAGIPLFRWLAIVIGVPLLFLFAGLLNRLLGMAVGAAWRRIRQTEQFKNPQILPTPARLLIVAWAIHWLQPRFGVSFFARQFWSTLSLMISIAACVWLLILLNAWVESYLLDLRGRTNGSASVLRLIRRSVDVLLIFVGVLVILNHFNVNLTAAMAGLGVGGIAVALAAQKTLENVIAGVSLIADKAVRVGDTLKAGDYLGTVEEVGLRSTRIRTLDRTLVSVPNGQIANLSLETLSARDKFWFHPLIGLRHDTSPEQIRIITAEIRRLLDEDERIESKSVRVRFIRLRATSLEVDIFAYVLASNLSQFLTVQEDLLLSIMDILRRVGVQTAFPFRHVYTAA